MSHDSDDPIGPALVNRIHHVAFAHPPDRPLHPALEQLLGLTVTHTEPGEGLTERMIPVGDGYVQSLEATGEGVVQRFVDRRGSALHHVAFEVDDVRAAVDQLRAAGVRVIDDEPRPGGMNTTIAFIHPSELAGLLVELVQIDPMPEEPSP